jgi:predicted cupin superfamily sugar epimerase
MAARPLGAYALVGCTMGPGFEPEGFALMRTDAPGVAAEVARRFPEVAGLI